MKAKKPQGRNTMTLTRRSFTAGAAGAVTTFGILRQARAATAYKMASNLPNGHPMLVRLQEAADAIKKDTNGEFSINFFPNSQLGGDLEVLTQLRSGAVQFYPLAGAQLSTLVPVASLNGVGFAFSNIGDVWKAMDGEVGGLIRGALGDSGLFVFDKMYDNGFRQITSGTRPIAAPGDLKGLPIRVPPSPLSTSLFKAFGAAPQSISFGEVYTALQTRLVEAQENPLSLVDSAKFYEVQKYVSMTNHMWDGFWILANRAAWNKLPQATRDIVDRHFNAAALLEREDVAKVNDSIAGKLKAAGMQFVEPDLKAFRAALNATTFYAEWKEKFGAKAWAALEKYTGKLG
jgi:tripartite ATP-independent transporter DctP family solute receptor